MEETKTDRDLLIEIRADVKHLLTAQADHEGRLRVLEAQRNRWLGRDGVIVTAISVAVSFAVALISGGWRG